MEGEVAELSPSETDTPFIPCFASCARCRCRGVCLDEESATLVPFDVSVTGVCSGGVTVVKARPTLIDGNAKRVVETEETLRLMDCSYEDDTYWLDDAVVNGTTDLFETA